MNIHDSQDCIMSYVYSAGSLALQEGPTTFACKSQECRLAGLVYLN